MGNYVSVRDVERAMSLLYRWFDTFEHEGLCEERKERFMACRSCDRCRLLAETKSLIGKYGMINE